jgi:hypothetical protein
LFFEFERDHVILSSGADQKQERNVEAKHLSLTAGMWGRQVRGGSTGITTSKQIAVQLKRYERYSPTASQRSMPSRRKEKDMVEKSENSAGSEMAE